MWILREDKGREDVLRTCGKTSEANLLLFSEVTWELKGDNFWKPIDVKVKMDFSNCHCDANSSCLFQHFPLFLCYFFFCQTSCCCRQVTSVVSDSMRPHRWQRTRLFCPLDSPGNDTGVGYHILLQCMKVKTENEVAQSCLTLWDPMDCSPPGSSIHGIFQARVLEWGAIAFSTVRQGLKTIGFLNTHAFSF